MESDLRTALTLMVWLTLGFTVIAMAIRWARRTHHGYGRWSIAGLLLVLSLFLLSWRPGPIWINTVSANAGIALASILYLEGARKFRNLASRNWPSYAGGAVTIGAVAFFAYVVPNMNARAGVMSTFLAIVLALVAITLLRGLPPAHKFGQVFSGGMFALCAATLLGRAIYCYFGPLMSDRNALTGTYGVFFAVIVAEMAAFSLGLALLADERAAASLEDARGQASRADAEVAQHIKAEAALRESEERFRTLADSAPVMIWMSGLDKLCTFFNKPWLDFTGRSMEQEQGNGWAEGVHPGDLDRCLATYNSSFDARRPFQMEYRLRCADGEYRWILYRGTPLYREREFAGFIGSAIDVTDQKRMEERFRANETRLLAAQRLTKVGSWERRFDTRDSSIWSEEMFQTLGITPDHSPSFDLFLSCVHPEDRGIVLDAAHRIPSGTAPGECRMVRPDGAVRLVRTVSEVIRNQEGEPVRIVGATQDITERKEAEAALRESEEHLKNAERLAHLGHWQWDIRANRISGSEEMSRIFGQPRSYIPTYEGFLQSLVPADKERVDRAVRDSLARKTGHSLEYQISHPNGDLRTISCIWEVVHDEAGAPVRMFGTCQDVTDLRHAQKEDFARQKLETVGTLANGIAHDFNNLLGGVLAQAELALGEISDGSSPEDELKAIRDVAIRGSEIVRELMIYAGNESSAEDLVDLSRIVKEMIELLKISVSKHAAIETDLGANLPAARADAAQLRQIVMNLVTNASEAIGDRDGTIRVTTKCIQARRDAPAAIPDRLPGDNYLQLEVSDTGRGMPSEIQAKVFDPFFSTKSASRGIGLAVVQGIVRGLQGAIHFVSQPGKGTTFRVLLPCTETTASNTLDVSFGGAEVARSVEGVGALIVEDEAPLRKAVAAMLRKVGFEVMEAADGFSAIEIIGAHASKIDVILLDLTIPGASSREVIAGAAKGRPDVRVVLTSAYSQEQQMVAEAMSAPQIHSFIRKPYEFGDLLHKLRNALAS
ncbi:MAG TPA: PAS domain-containing protein [Bryobacteraceae bacterium]